MPWVPAMGGRLGSVRRFRWLPANQGLGQSHVAASARASWRGCANRLRPCVATGRRCCTAARLAATMMEAVAKKKSSPRSQGTRTVRLLHQLQGFRVHACSSRLVCKITIPVPFVGSWVVRYAELVKTGEMELLLSHILRCRRVQRRIRRVCDADDARPVGQCHEHDDLAADKARKMWQHKRRKAEKDHSRPRSNSIHGSRQHQQQLGHTDSSTSKRGARLPRLQGFTKKSPSTSHEPGRGHVRQRKRQKKWLT